MATADLESRIQTYGKEIFARLEGTGPTLFSKGWLDEQMMGLTMGNEALKVQLFRFVDTLPYLIDSPKEISRHLREYLQEAQENLPWWVRGGVNFIPKDGLGSRVLAKAARTNAIGMAKKFIAGSNVPEAIEAVSRMRKEGLAFTIDLLGEATITEAEADHVQQQYFDLLNGLTETVNHWPEIPTIDRDDRGPIPRVNVSVKLSALYSQFDPIDPVGTARAVGARLRPILALAKKTGAFVNFDMEQYSFKETTLYIFREILSEPEFRDWPDVGIAIQVYLKETEVDLQKLLEWVKTKRRAPVWIRLVKGAYWDYETVLAQQHGWPSPVFEQKWQSDANFEKLTRFLLAHADYLTPAFGSHNIRSISHALAVAEELKVPLDRLEFQMLYGMADPVKDVLKSMGRRIRVYTPYGELLPGMAYLVRRLLENTSNDSFLRAGFAEGLPEEVLLKAPQSTTKIKAANPARPDQSIQMTAVPKSSPTSSSDANATFPKFVNEPLADFAQEANRTAMSEALLNVQANQLGKTYWPIIDGKEIRSVRTVPSVNPSRHSQILGFYGSASAAEAQAAIQTAKARLDSWRELSILQRGELLNRAAEVMRKRRWELSAWIILESGKPWREADADVAEAIDFCVYYAQEMAKLGEQHRNVPGEENIYFYEPRGVSVVIAPWNFPLAILCGMAAAALVAGNTVILKPAEQTSIIGAKLMEVFIEAGVPNGVVNFLPGDGEEIGPTLVNHPDTALIAFTGSLKVALAIYEQASRVVPGQTMVKKVIAEMGGKNAIIIDSDADLDEAVKGVVDSAFGFGGQKCSAGSRAIVLAGIYDQFLTRLIEATKSLTVGPADAPGSSYGPVIDAEARDRILATIEAGKADARLVYQMDLGALANEGYFVGPAIFADVPETSNLALEEIFGPVLCVMKANDLDDALRIANGTKYALTGGIYSRSPEHLKLVRKRFRVGNLYINRKCTGALVDRQPFGGFKLSGIGSKAGGPDYLLQFVVPRTITENTMRRGFAPEILPGD